jgi:hypothetical protein
MQVKGINNRQKPIVKPRENIQRYLSQQKNVQWVLPLSGEGSEKRVRQKGKSRSIFFGGG